MDLLLNQDHEISKFLQPLPSGFNDLNIKIYLSHYIDSQNPEREKLLLQSTGSKKYSDLFCSEPGSFPSFITLVFLFFFCGNSK